MKTSTLSKLGVALVTCGAISSIMLSQGAFAQGEGSETGFATLVGRDPIRSSDPRFQPVASLVVSESTERAASGAKAQVFFTRYIVTNYIDRYLISSGMRGGGRSEAPRELTASEALLLEELFTHDLGKARSAEITNDGFSGAVRPQDLDLSAQEVMAKAKARGAAKSSWYDKGAKELGPGK